MYVRKVGTLYDFRIFFSEIKSNCFVMGLVILKLKNKKKYAITEKT